MLTPCPCNPAKLYRDCCGPLLSGSANATTPEQLMRSRYTAFTRADVNYLLRTMCGPVRENFNAATTQQWAQQVAWLGLEVLAAPAVQIGAAVGEVEFKAHYREANRVQTIHERSQFIYKAAAWFYVNEATQPVSPRKPQATRLGRNALCACGSRNKYKKCCGK